MPVYTSSMASTILAILAFLGWGMNDALMIRLFRKNDPAKITVATGIVRILCWALLLPFFLHEFFLITLTPLLFNLIAGFSSAMGYFLFGKASKHANPMIVTTITGGWGVSAVILGILLFGERSTPSQLLASVVVFVGLFLTTYQIKSIKTLRMKPEKGILYALGGFLVWGICGAFLKFPAISYGWYWTSVVMLIPYLPILFLIERKNIKAKELFHIKELWVLFFVVVCIMLGDLGYNGSFSYGGSIVVVGTIGGSYAVFSTIIAYFFYKERPSLQQCVGIIVALSGIVLSAYLTNLS